MRLLPEPRLRNGEDLVPRKPVQRIYVFGRHPNPTADYYFEGRFGDSRHYPYAAVDIRGKDFDALDPEGAYVVLCRYASADALSWIERNASVLAGVVLFLDDNIPAIVTGDDATIAYRFFLYYRALYPLKRLSKHLDAVWVSTPALGRSLRHLAPKIVPPAPPERFWQFYKATPNGSCISIAYHATGIHHSEHLFLRPIIEKVLAQQPHAQFEVFADKRAARIWRNMERVTVRSPVGWSEYLKESSSRQIDIMLVPLTPSLVNDCRAPTKRIDVARFNAAGIFSVSEAYGMQSSDEEILLPYDPDAWKANIIKLIANGEMRARAAAATRTRVAAMMRNAIDDNAYFPSGDL